MVGLAVGAKRRVLTKVSSCPLVTANQPIRVELNILPLGSYDFLIGMDWLEKHWSLINYKTKTINFQDDKGGRQEMQCI